MAITPLPPAPLPTDTQAEFNTKAFALVAGLDPFVTEANALADDVNVKQLQISASASQAAASATDSLLASQISQAAANFKGRWVDLSGALAVPASVFHEGEYWMLLQNVGNVSAEVPGVSPAWDLLRTVTIIRTPTPVQPLSGATSVSPSPILEADEYASIYSALLRENRRFQVDLQTGDFSSPVYEFADDVDSHTVADTLAFNTGHKWRCRDEATDGTFSRWSPVQTFSTGAIAVNQPTLTVEGSPDEVPESPTLTTSAFATTPTGEDTHLNTDWQVLDDQLNVVWESLADASNKLSIVVPAATLDPDTTYTFRARHRGTTYGAGPYATVVATTLAQFAPDIGDAFGGGFFAGVIANGVYHRVVVAPLASGESSTTLQYKNAQTAAPAATQTLNNGPAATAAMVAAGNSTVYPAAHFCNDLSIGGFSDWYLPARDELELCYRNLKPTTASNSTSNRQLSAITYPEGNDLSADTLGVNRNSDPAGAAYTSGNPAQTSVSAFQDSNTEAFDDASYWSSSEYSAASAWAHGFGNGLHSNFFKDNSRRVRAVRRVPVGPAIGEFYQGGYVAGMIKVSGVVYYVIVAPKATGENASLQWKNANTAGPAATQTLNDGLAATAAMVADGDATVYPAAHFCAGLTINGYSDWYLPARDELELCYRNLKPTTGANNTSNRALSAITYPEGNDVSADTMGVNRNSVSVGSGYTASGYPFQTNVALFQDGGDEAFAAEAYGSSSELTATAAWRHFFNDGIQGSSSKSGNRRVRAVRRVPVVI